MEHWDKEPKQRSEEAVVIVKTTDDLTQLPDESFKNQMNISGDKKPQAAGLKILSLDDFVPESRVRIRDIIDRQHGNCIGIKRLTYNGLTGYPQSKPTHVYIWYVHFFELKQLMEYMMKFHPPTTKFIKVVECHYEFDMYMRPFIHKDFDSKDCSLCRDYLEKVENRSVWWFEIEGGNFIRMTFKNFWKENTFECCSLWIKRYGMVEVELQIEKASEARNRRNFRTHLM